MALENAEYISQLVPTNPPGTDQAATSDDHLRVIKRAVQQSFPNVNGVVNATPAQLNGLTSLGNNLVVFTNASGILSTSTYTSASLARISNALAANSALVSDANGYVSAHPTVSTTEIGYLNGVSSAIQTQLDAKSAIAHDHTGGSETQIPTAGIADLAVTVVKLAAQAVNASKINFTLAAITSQVVAQSGGTYVMPAGLFVVVPSAPSLFLQVNSGGWRTSGSTYDGGTIISDGTNVRFINPGSGSPSTLYMLQLQ